MLGDDLGRTMKLFCKMLTRKRGLLALIAVAVLCVIFTMKDQLLTKASFVPVELSSSQQLQPPVVTEKDQEMETKQALRLPFDTKASALPEVKLLIVTYMRSGSTFTGDLFNQNPDVFYVFEPLHALNQYTAGQSWVLGSAKLLLWKQKSLTEDQLKNESLMQQLKEDVMKGYLNCNFVDVLPNVVTDGFLRIGNKTKPFRLCLDAHPGIIGILQCLPEIQRSCRSAKAVVLKTIRYTVEKAKALMASDSQVKVIHLIRDPRGTLRSRIGSGEIRWERLVNFSRHYCQRVAKDLAMGDEVRKQFPGRLVRVRYEDIALQPVPFASKLLAFAGLSLSPRQKEYLEEMTSAVEHKICKNCVKVLKTNSTAAAFSWRGAFDFYHTSAIDAGCGYVYEKAGYLPLDTEKDLVDLSVPSMLDTGSVPGFLA